MSFRFSIKNTQDVAEKEGNEIVRYSGVSEPFNQSTERESSEVGVDGAGNPVVEFNTGLDVAKVDLYRWLSDDEKTELKKQIKELLPTIERSYGGKAVIDSRNQNFWGRKKKEVNKLKVDNTTEHIFFDTANAQHALLYLSIMSGAFMDVVAPSREWALRHQLPHYLELESQATNFNGDQDITRSDAHLALGELRKDSPEALLILSWCILSETTSFAGINKATSTKDIVTGLIHYIDGKLVSKKKKNCARNFIEYAEKWKSQVLRPSLYAEAYLKAGEYFAFINQREKKYVSNTGTILGNTVTESVENLLKPKFQTDLETLRDFVEKKWSE